MNANEMKEQMERMDKEEKTIDDIIAEIERQIKELSEISPKEAQIMEKIKKSFDERKLKYDYDEEDPKHIELGFGIDNKPFKIHILLHHSKISLRLSFPFKVQTNAYPLMCMLMAEFNTNKAFSILNVNPDNGRLTMEYSAMMDDPNDFNEEYFDVYMTSLIKPALDIYTKTVHLSVGMVSNKDKKRYRELLKMALATLDGDFDDDNDVTYGAGTQKFELHRSPSHIVEEDEDDDADTVDEDTVSDTHTTPRRIPSFDEFMRMREQTEKHIEEKSEPLEKPADMLSMFSKRTDEQDPKTEGENEDE